LGIAHILWEGLMWNYQIFVIGNVFMCAINCNYRMAATAYTVQVWFVLGM
jgi:hypothetical protein